MSTVVDWQETAGGISINQRVPMAARLFGIPFLAVGVVVERLGPEDAD